VSISKHCHRLFVPNVTNVRHSRPVTVKRYSRLIQKSVLQPVTCATDGSNVLWQWRHFRCTTPVPDATFHSSLVTTERPCSRVVVWRTKNSTTKPCHHCFGTLLLSFSSGLAKSDKKTVIADSFLIPFQGGYNEGGSIIFVDTYWQRQINENVLFYK